MHTIPFDWPRLVAGAAMILLGLWLVRLDRRWAVRAFAALLLARGLSNLNLHRLTHEPDLLARLAVLDGVLELTLAALAVVFALLYPRTRSWVAGRVWPWVALAVLWLVPVTIYLLDPSRLDVLAVDETGALASVQAGWLAPVALLQQPLYVAIGLVFAADYAREAPGPLRTGILLVSVGWAADSFSSAVQATLLASLDTGPVSPSVGGQAGSTVGTASTALWALALVLGLVLLGVYIVLLARAGDEGQRRLLRFGISILELAGASGLVVVLAGPETVFAGAHVDALRTGFWKLAIPLLVTYALVRHRVFDLDLRIKWTIRQSTVAAIFIAVFFVVSEGAAVLFEDQTGSTWAGIIAAGALLFAIAPLQRAAGAVADKAMPNVKPVTDMDEGERIALYREQLVAAWADGSISGDERRMLNVTRERLGIPADVALRLEEEAAP